MVLKLPRANVRPSIVTKNKEKEEKKQETKREFLEVQPKESMDFSKIVENCDRKVRNLYENSDIPPLEYC